MAIKVTSSVHYVASIKIHVDQAKGWATITLESDEWGTGDSTEISVFGIKGKPPIVTVTPQKE